MSGLFQRRFQALAHLALIPVFCFCSVLLSLPGCAGGQRGTNISGSGTVRSLSGDILSDVSIESAADGSITKTDDQGSFDGLPIVPGIDNTFIVESTEGISHLVLRAEDFSEGQTTANFTIVVDGEDAVAIFDNENFPTKQGASSSKPGVQPVKTPEVQTPTNKPQKTPSKPSGEEPEGEAPAQEAPQENIEFLELQLRVANCATGEDSGPHCWADCESYTNGEDYGDSTLNEYCQETEQTANLVELECQNPSIICSDRGKYCTGLRDRYQERLIESEGTHGNQYAEYRRHYLQRLVDFIDQAYQGHCIDIAPVDPLPTDPPPGDPEFADLEGEKPVKGDSLLGTRPDATTVTNGKRPKEPNSTFSVPLEDSSDEEIKGPATKPSSSAKL